VAIGQAIRESKRLLRKVFTALTEVDGQKIGAAKMDDRSVLATPSSISERTKDIEGTLA
jgi:hypothetical protein